MTTPSSPGFEIHDQRGGERPGDALQGREGRRCPLPQLQLLHVDPAEAGALLLTVPTSFTPGGVAIGDDRSIYVAHYDAGKIHRFSATGADLGIFASYAGCDTGCGTDFIKFDADGNLFVADLQPLGRVRLISPEGTDLGNFVTTNIPGGVEGLGFDARGISTSPTLATPASASSRRSRRREKISGRSRRRYATASPSIARAIFTRRRARVPSG